MKDNEWLLMTYYCPTHGRGDRSTPIQITREELRKESEGFSKKDYR